MKLKSHQTTLCCDHSKSSYQVKKLLLDFNQSIQVINYKMNLNLLLVILSIAVPNCNLNKNQIEFVN